MIRNNPPRIRVAVPVNSPTKTANGEMAPSLVNHHQNRIELHHRILKTPTKARIRVVRNRPKIVKDSDRGRTSVLACKVPVRIRQEARKLALEAATPDL